MLQVGAWTDIEEHSIHASDGMDGMLGGRPGGLHSQPTKLISDEHQDAPSCVVGPVGHLGSSDTTSRRWRDGMLNQFRYVIEDDVLRP